MNDLVCSCFSPVRHFSFFNRVMKKMKFISNITLLKQKKKKKSFYCLTKKKMLPSVGKKCDCLIGKELFPVPPQKSEMLVK